MDRQIFDRMQAIEDRHWWFRARREILADQIARLPLPPAAKVLEVGCGTGGNLAMLARFGALSAIEPDPAARAHATQRSGVPVAAGGLPGDIPFPAGGFDLAAALDVLEHVDEDTASVEKLATLIKPGGFLVATVPAYQWMWTDHDAMHHHKRRYTLPRLARLFPPDSWAIRKTSYFNSALFPAIAGVRGVKKVFGLAGGDEEALPGPALNRLLTGVFAAEKLWLARASFPFGVSILVIAERVGDRPAA